MTLIPSSIELARMRPCEANTAVSPIRVLNVVKLPKTPIRTANSVRGCAKEAAQPVATQSDATRA